MHCIEVRASDNVSKSEHSSGLLQSAVTHVLNRGFRECIMGLTTSENDLELEVNRAKRETDAKAISGRSGRRSEVQS